MHIYKHIYIYTNLCIHAPIYIYIYIILYEMGLLFSPNKREVYFHYVNDTFCLFNSKTEADLFFTSLNQYPYSFLNLL